MLVPKKPQRDPSKKHLFRHLSSSVLTLSRSLTERILLQTEADVPSWSEYKKIRTRKKILLTVPTRKKILIDKYWSSLSYRKIIRLRAYSRGNRECDFLQLSNSHRENKESAGDGPVRRLLQPSSPAVLLLFFPPSFYLSSSWLLGQCVTSSQEKKITDHPPIVHL